VFVASAKAAANIAASQKNQNRASVFFKKEAGTKKGRRKRPPNKEQVSQIINP
jgi:hypothetical protein